MKKKIVSLLLVFCILCISIALTACGESTFDTINNALEKSQALTSLDAEMKLEMNMAMEGMTLSIPMTAEIKAKGLHDENPVVSTNISMAVLGQNMDMSMYQEGEWAYMVMEDMKYKTKLADVESEYDYTDDVNNMLQDIPEDLFKDVEAVKDKDGSTSVTIAIPDTLFADIYADFVDDINSSAGMEGTDIKIKDAVVKITVANGYVTVYDMEFAMEMTVEGIAVKADVSAGVTYNNPGQEVTVTPPAGYESFEELSLDFDE